MNDQPGVTQASMSDLKGLLARQERSSRRWRWLAVGMVLAVIILMLMGQAQLGQTMKVIAAERFIIKDSGCYAPPKIWTGIISQEDDGNRHETCP